MKTNVMQIVRLVMMIVAVAGIIYALEYMERDFKEDAESDSLDAAIDELGADYTEEEIRLVRIKFICEQGN